MTDLRGVDLGRYAFDFDLTFAVLLMHPDGHVYHRYGARDERGADVWLSLTSFERVLERTLEEHERYGAAPKPPEPREPLRLETVPAFQRRDRGECIHCHSVFPALYEERRAAGRWREEERWVYPPPARIGLDLERDDPSRVRAVVAGSPAAAAGIRVGDRLLASGTQSLASSSDLMQALHDFDAQGGALDLALERDGAARALALELGPGWKRGTALEFSWRPFKWGFTPDPGFGGEALSRSEKTGLGLGAEAFAFRVTYLVTWGENRRFGEEARRAGIREGDVFLSVDGRSDFVSVDHFHAWWRLEQRVETTTNVECLREGSRQTFPLRVLP